MIGVVNIKTCPDWGKEGDVYIGRGSPWGNPFRLFNKDPFSRLTVIKQYELFIIPKLNLTPLLSAKRLGCYCKPLPCHGDVLVKYIERLNYGEGKS